MFGVSDKDIQFGRQCSVIFDNYATGESTKINDYDNKKDSQGNIISMFRIGFEFTKSLDENSNWSNGSVKIYGLTLDTFNSLGDYLETEVEVQVGYEYSKSRQLSKLFRAVLIDKSYTIESGISVSTFNLQGYYLLAQAAKVDGNSSGKISMSFPDNTLFLTALQDILNRTNFNGFDLDTEDIKKRFPDNWLEFQKYVKRLKFETGKSYFGTPKDILSAICKEYGLGYTINNNNRVIAFFLPDAIIWHFQQIYPNLPKRVIKDPFDETVVKSPVSKNDESQFNFRNGTDSILLNGDTGLIGLPSVKTKVVTKSYNGVVETSEKVYIKKEITVKKNKKGEDIIGKDTDKAKLKVPKTKKVLRRSVEAVCLINPIIEPQVYVTLDLKNDNDLNGDYRVRTVAISGDTESGSWTMNLSLEGEW